MAKLLRRARFWASYLGFVLLSVEGLQKILAYDPYPRAWGRRLLGCAMVACAFAVGDRTYAAEKHEAAVVRS